MTRGQEALQAVDDGFGDTPVKGPLFGEAENVFLGFREGRAFLEVADVLDLLFRHPRPSSVQFLV